jgi:hypothetical protein
MNLIPLSLPWEAFHALVEHSGEGFYGEQSRKNLCDLIYNWTKGTRLPGQVTLSMRGYQWKRLFLPEGTRLRATYRGVALYAQVEGESIMHDGVAVSPSQLANASGCGSRNAWRVIWVQLPGETDWTPAARFRDD